MNLNIKNAWTSSGLVIYSSRRISRLPGNFFMRVKLAATTAVIAALACTIGSVTSKAAPVEVTFNINSGSYQNELEGGVSQSYFGTLTVTLSPNDYIAPADITFPSLGLEFNEVRVDGWGYHDVTYQFALGDTTDQYYLSLIIDNPNAMFAGHAGATIDTSSTLIQSGTLIGESFAGNIAVAPAPAPAALPVFVSALAMLGICKQRRKYLTGHFSFRS